MGENGAAHPGPQQDQVVPKGRGAAQQGAHIAGVLHSFQRQDVGGGVQPLYRGRGLFKQHKHALARLGARQLFGHVRRDQRGAQAFQRGRLFHSRLGGISRARGAAFGQFQAKLRPLGKNSPSAARCFSLSRSVQAYFTPALSRLVIISIVAPLSRKINVVL